MKTIEIDTTELIELSENCSIELYCVTCKSVCRHSPVAQVTKGSTTSMGFDEETGMKIELEDVEDAYIVQCSQCGLNVIARWKGRDLFPPPKSGDRSK